MESAVPNPEIDIHSDDDKVVFIGHYPSTLYSKKDYFEQK